MRIESVAARIGITSLAYLWQRSQEQLLTDIIASGVKAIIIKTAALGLNKKHVGMMLDGDALEYLTTLHDKYDLHVCGEGGEYESLTLDCPLYRYARHHI